MSADNSWWINAIPVLIAFGLASWFRSWRKKPGSKSGGEKP